MVPAALRRLGTLGLIALWVLVSGGLLLLLALSVQNSVQFSQLQSWILLANVIALIAVGWMLTRKIVELVRNFRAQVPGSRLTARTVAIFGSLVVAPLIIVYLFSLEFLNRGIDSWFKVEIKQGLTDALELSKSAVDVRMREYARSTQLFANRLAESLPLNLDVATDQQRVESGALEVVVYGKLGQVLAASSAGASSTLPRASAEVTAAMDAGNVYWSLEPLSEDDYLINTAAPIASAPGSSEGRFVVALYPVPPHLVRLSEAVQHSYSQHSNLTSQREGVKNLFGMTLTLVLLLAMLTAIYGAIYSAEKLTRPVQDLIAGTRAVGKGDFGTRLPLPSRDEMGFLVHSFNDMTKRLRRAREETTRSQMAVERERERLSIILARLSTGVITLGRDLVLRSANEAASNILGVALEQRSGPAAAPGAESENAALRAVRQRSHAAAVQGRRRMARAARAEARGRGCPRAGVRLHTVARRRSCRETSSSARAATSSCSTTSAPCCRRSATRPGARWRAASRTRSRIRSHPSSCPPSACGAATSRR